MPFQFTLCDVFTDRPFSGNQLAVFQDATGMSDETMAGVAREFAWSEVTFVLPRPGGKPRVRIWTPRGELSFAGHPIVGTAVVLAATRPEAVEIDVLEVANGEIEIKVSGVSRAGGRGTMQQGAPVFGTILKDRGRVAAALSLHADDLAPGLESQIVCTGSQHVMVPVRSGDALARARVVPDLLGALLDAVGARRAYLFAVDTPQSNAAARARLLGVDMEDAATGSAAGALGAYLVHYGLHRAGAFDIEQGISMGRPSRISVEVSSLGKMLGPVTVSGDVRIWGNGSFEVLD